MNIFILCTGRCGSTTLVQACKFIKNYTVAHESRSEFIGKERFNYPNNHIEVDNRLSWFLGRLDKTYGDQAIYVHLKRDHYKVAQSFLKRWNFNAGIINAYRKGIILGTDKGIPEYIDPMMVCLDYCKTVDRNIQFFLKDKSKSIEFDIDNAKEDFQKFWNFINAKGDLQGAISCFDKTYNSEVTKTPMPKGAKKVMNKTVRIFLKIPYFIKNA